MGLKIRLARAGAKKRPHYRIVVTDVRNPRDGRFLEKVGTYNPLLPKDDAERVRLNEERIKFWLDRGALPSDRVGRFLGDAEDHFRCRNAAIIRTKLSPRRKHGSGLKLPNRRRRKPLPRRPKRRPLRPLPKKRRPRKRPQKRRLQRKLRPRLKRRPRKSRTRRGWRNAPRTLPPNAFVSEPSPAFMVCAARFRIKTFTETPAALTDYAGLTDEQGQTVRLSVKEVRADLLIATIEGVGDRDAAQALKGTRLYIPRAALPEAGEEEYYHADLIGLAVERVGGVPIGVVKAVHDFGAGDVLEIAAEHETLMLPFTRDAVPEVDLANGRLVVDPPPGLLGSDPEDSQ